MPHRVLVVDADREALARDSGILADAGYLVTSASDFAEAKHRLLLAPPDLLLVDVRLGAYNGLHLIHRGRASHPEIPAILTDRTCDPVLEAEARRAQALYMIKPVEETTLLSTVRHLLAGRPADPGD